jgi:heme exporter protein D
MSFETFADFLAMGKHGLYVWLSYGVAVLVIAANVLALRRQRRRFFREAAALERRREAGSR